MLLLEVTQQSFVQQSIRSFGGGIEEERFIGWSVRVGFVFVDAEGMRERSGKEGGKEDASEWSLVRSQRRG